MNRVDRVKAERAPPDPTGHCAAWVFFLVFVALAVGIVTVAYLAHRNYKQHFRAEVDRQISAIAALKVGELVRWRRDRMDDAAIFFKNPSFSILVRRFFERPADADAQRQLLDWLGKYSKLDDYDQVRLMDVQSVTRLSIPAGLSPARSNTVRAASEVLRTGQITLQDFYRDEHDQRIYLAVLVPILDESDANRPLGVLVLRIDPAIFLYPFIKRWPTPSLTAETLLVRKDGNEVVFLNELQFQTNTAMNLRAPSDLTTLPAAQAALGREGVMEGIDYRGEPVVAALQTIPDSPWALVARMDAAEVYAPARERLWQSIVLVALMLCGAGAAVGLVWRQQRVRFYRNKAEAGEVLRASELRYRRLFESAKDGILILDAETGMVVDVNPFLIQLLGFSREAFLGKKIWELGFFKDIVANKDHFAELQQQEYIRYEDKPLQTADGRKVDVEFVSNVYRVNHQKVIQCNIRDISERKQMERALRASEQEFRSLAESMPQIVWVTRADGWNIYFNQQWVDYTGLTMEQSYGHGWNTPFHPDDKQRAWEAWQRATQHNDTYSVECRLRRADGVYRWWLIRGLPLRNASGAILKWFGTCTDIDDIKVAEAERNELQAQLLQSQKLESIGTLAGGVAHEINNPIMGIMNYAQLIVDKLGPDNPVTEYATEIGKETQRVATIVTNLLSFARLDKETQRSPAGLCDIVEDTLSMIRAVMRHDQITLEVNVPADLPKILCRSQQIRQVLMNLLTNARDALNQKYPGHNDDKVIVVSAEVIEVGTRSAERGSEEIVPTSDVPSSELRVPRSVSRILRLTVEDHGPGIPEELRERIFNPFFSTKPHHKGTGLGLSISHGIVRDHGGKLSVESEVGQWTRFNVDLPVVDGAP